MAISGKAREAFEKQLEAYVGIDFGIEDESRDAVNQAMIRHWCEVMQDANPIYTDEVAAEASLHGRVVAPPAMLQAWILGGVAMAGGEDDPRDKQRELHRFTSPAEVEELGRWLTDTKTANRLETAFAAMSDRENIETFTRKINAGKSAYLARVSKAMAMVEDGGFFRVYLENRKNFLDGFDALLKRVCGLPAPEAEVMRQVQQSQAVSLFVLGNLYAFDGKPETEMDRYFAGLQSEAGKRFAALNDQVGRAAFLGWANSLAHKEKAARQQEPPPD